MQFHLNLIKIVGSVRSKSLKIFLAIRKFQNFGHFWPQRVRMNQNVTNNMLSPIIQLYCVVVSIDSDQNCGSCEVKKSENVHRDGEN